MKKRYNLFKSYELEIVKGQKKESRGENTWD